MASARSALLLLLALHTRTAAAASLYDFEADDLATGLPVPMSYYKGKVLLVVNVASQCGYTESTYQMLNTLHSKYAGKGLAILAFPCNSFGGQEPGSPGMNAQRTHQTLWSFAANALHLEAHTVSMSMSMWTCA